MCRAALFLFEQPRQPALLFPALLLRQPLPHLLDARRMVLHIWMPKLTLKINTHLHQLNCSQEIALLLKCQAQVPACIAFAAPVANRPRYLYVLLVVADRLPRIA